MLPTKGYFQDIECPYYDNICNRPYCHFRHKKKTQDTTEEVSVETPKETEVPTYKPTPKSELANIKSHIPISYVPDLAFRADRTIRPLPKFTFEKPTYKPTPLSILSSANKRENDSEDNEKESKENIETIREIKQNIANVEYNPQVSLQEDINFEDLSAEFDLIDDIIENPNDIKVSLKNKRNQQKHAEPVSISRNENEDKKERSSRDKEKSEKHSSSSSKHKSSSSSSRNKKDTKDKSDKSRESSRDKHKHKKSDRDRDKEKSSSHRSSHKSSRDKEKSRNSEKDKHKSSRSKEKDKEKRDKEKRRREQINDKKRKSSDVSSDDNCELITETNNFEDYSDIDLEDEDTISECFKIFSEYEPPKVESTEPVTSEASKQSDEDPVTSKKRIAHSSNHNFSESGSKIQCSKPKIQPTAAQTMVNRFKLAKLAQANNEQKNIIEEVKQGAIKRPPPSLLEAARSYKLQRMSIKEKPPENVNIVDSILNSNKSKPKKIAPVANVNSIQRAKAKIEEIAKQKASETLNKTPAQSIKGKRVAHVPDMSLSDIPDVLNADKSKLAVNVRTRFLTMIADECVKLYLIKEDAYNRALNEEFSCYEKCKVLATYKNSAMLAVNRLRKELLEREKLGLGPIGEGESLEKDSATDFKGKKFYNHIKHYILTEEDLDIHGYPKESSIHGRAIIKNRRNKIDVSLGENQRKCCRCSKIYLVDEDGFVLYPEECLYHPLKKRTLRGEQTYLCCKSNDDAGCVTSNTHVSESGDSDLEGFQTTMKPESEEDPRSYSVYALDCEMCYTIKGLELTRVTIVDSDCKTVYESLVKPLNPIIDYNTTFSGITREQMEKTSTSILQVQANILHLCNSKTILIGHSLESDLKALKIIHGTIIDTSVLFPHKMGLPHKRALKVLASEFLKKIIQNNVSGHDSAEDAITCMELVKWKLKEELKVRGIK